MNSETFGNFINKIFKEDPSNLRMYSLVMYNLSSIQQGIQMAHSNAEYSLKYPDYYDEWANKGKTIIVLNGGTSLDLDHPLNTWKTQGSMQNHLDKLISFGYPYAYFREPDLNFAVSAISFVVPKSIYSYNFCHEASDHTLDELSYMNLVKNWLSTFKLA